jgi:hypothetical protein
MLEFHVEHLPPIVMALREDMIRASCGGLNIDEDYRACHFDGPIIFSLLRSHRFSPLQVLLYASCCGTVSVCISSNLQISLTICEGL